jgi:hypothetical protein
VISLSASVGLTPLTATDDQPPGENRWIPAGVTPTVSAGVSVDSCPPARQQKTTAAITPQRHRNATIGIEIRIGGPFQFPHDAASAGANSQEFCFRVRVATKCSEPRKERRPFSEIAK